MSTILLDTNIVSFIFKGDSRALDYEVHLKNHHLAISFMTVAELYQWAAIRQWGERRKSQLLETLQAQYTLLSFKVRMPVTEGTRRPCWSLRMRWQSLPLRKSPLLEV